MAFHSLQDKGQDDEALAFINKDVARALYLKKGFVDIPKHNENYRADVFMEKKLLSP